jgi:rhodanese-related sulfurtransferase
MHLEPSHRLRMPGTPAIAATPDTHRETIVKFHLGIRSCQVALFPEHQGYCSVVNLSGGLDARVRHTDSGFSTY